MFDPFVTGFGQMHLAGFFIDEIIAGHLILHFRVVGFFLTGQVGDHLIGFQINIGTALGLTGNDQRRSGFIDQNGVYLVDNRKVQIALHFLLQAESHVVAQVIETEFVVGAVGNIGGVGGLALVVIQIADDYAGAQSQEAIELAHGVGVAARQIIVDGHHMHALGRQG